MATSPYSPAEAALMQQGLQANLPQTYPYIQRSQYLADALQKLGSESQTIRSPGALAANLGSELLLQLGRKRADKQLLAATLAAQTQQNNMLEGSLGSDPSADAPTAPAGPMGASSPAPVNPSSVTPASYTMPPTNTPSPPMTNAGQGQQPDYGAIAGARDLMARLMVGEAGGNNAGQKAVASVVMNRSAKSGLSPDQVINAPGQFEPIDNPNTRARLLAMRLDDPRMQQAGANVDSVVNNGPTTNADHFWSPQAQAALGRQPPAWAAPGQNIGGNVFTQAGYQAPANPPPMMQTPQGQSPAASQGPAPSAPMGAPPVGPSPMGGASPPMPQPTQPPGPQQFMTHGPTATPQERTLVHSLLTNPATRAQGIALAQKLAEQYAARPTVGQGGGFYGSDGQYHSTNQVHTIQQGPAGLQQQEDLTGKISSVGNPNVGAVAPNSVASFAPGGGAQVTPMQGATSRRLTPEEVASGRFGQFQPGSVVEYDPLKGTANVVQAPPVDAKALQTSRDSWRNSDETKKATEAITAYNGLAMAIQRAAGPNGVLDNAATDSFLRGINPGVGAKQTTVNSFLSHLGLSQEVQGWILSNVDGKGYITPQTLNQMMSVIQSYAQAHAQVAQGYAQNDLKAYSQYGVTPDQLGENLPPLAAAPHVQWLNGNATPQQQPGQPQPMVQPPPQPQAQRRPGVRVYNPMTGKLE